MGSLMTAKIKVLEPYTADFFVHIENGTFNADRSVSMVSEEEQTIDLHFGSNANNFGSISVTIMNLSAMSTSDRDSGIVKANYYAITCVADWMWFLLTLDHEYHEYLEIVEARPDPRKLVASAPVYIGRGPDR